MSFAMINVKNNEDKISLGINLAIHYCCQRVLVHFFLEISEWFYYRLLKLKIKWSTNCCISCFWQNANKHVKLTNKSTRKLLNVTNKILGWDNQQYLKQDYSRMSQPKFKSTWRCRSLNVITDVLFPVYFLIIQISNNPISINPFSTALFE